MPALLSCHVSGSWILVPALCLGLIACSEPPPAFSSASALEGRVGASDERYLREQIQLALKAQRLYAPAGSNAIELYIALRSRQPGLDLQIENALAELQPYAVIGAEQATSRRDFDEAERIRQLIAAADPDAPSLPRIAARIAREAALAAEQASATSIAVEGQTYLEAHRGEDAKLDVTEEAQAAPAVPIGAPHSDETAPAAVQSPAAPLVASQPIAVVAPTAQVLPQNQRGASELVALRTPHPAYPREALRHGISGEVAVKFSVNTDGSVGRVAIVSAEPTGVFDRNVLAAVQHWKFKPIASPMDASRTFRFAR